MSFHSDLMLQLRADIATALSGIGADQVYAGRRSQKTPSEAGEVWIEAQPAENRARGGGNADQVHVYRVHRRVKEGADSQQIGDGQLDTLKADLETLRQRWNGTRPFVGALPNLVAMQVGEASVDEDPDDLGLLDGYLELRVLEKAS